MSTLSKWTRRAKVALRIRKAVQSHTTQNILLSGATVLCVIELLREFVGPHMPWTADMDAAMADLTSNFITLVAVPAVARIIAFMREPHKARGSLDHPYERI